MLRFGTTRRRADASPNTRHLRKRCALMQYPRCMVTVVKCPTCGRAVEWVEASRFRPFCSERCKLIDLGAWATEKYAIPGPPAEQSEEAPPSESPKH
jgi:endogenous inhibitor of DNA gyrase (YacG/DUF329 family)